MSVMNNLYICIRDSYRIQMGWENLTDHLAVRISFQIEKYKSSKSQELIPIDHYKYIYISLLF